MFYFIRWPNRPTLKKIVGQNVLGQNIRQPRMTMLRSDGNGDANIYCTESRLTYRQGYNRKTKLIFMTVAIGVYQPYYRIMEMKYTHLYDTTCAMWARVCVCVRARPSVCLFACLIKGGKVIHLQLCSREVSDRLELCSRYEWSKVELGGGGVVPDQVM